MRRGGGNFFEYVIPFDQFSENGVLMIELPWASVTNEELAAPRIGIGCARHRNGATHVRPVIELGFNRIAGSTLAPLIFLSRVLRVGIAALNHETLDHPMKTLAVI